MNVVFTANGHEVDYFFINSDYVADKLGDWAEKLYNLKSVITVGSKTYEFHPVYQLCFFLTYVLLGLAIWFVYAEFFRIADSHYELHMKLHTMKQDTYAKMSAISKERKDMLMSENIEAKMELIHFSKKYATSKKCFNRTLFFTCFPLRIRLSAFEVTYPEVF